MTLDGSGTAAALGALVCLYARVCLFFIPTGAI